MVGVFILIGIILLLNPLPSSCLPLWILRSAKFKPQPIKSEWNYGREFIKEFTSDSLLTHKQSLLALLGIAAIGLWNKR